MNEYIKEQLEAMLNQHLKNEAKLTEIQLKIEEYEERLKYAGTVFQSETKEIIESMQLSGRGFDNIISNTNNISNPVYSTVVNYCREKDHINKEDREFLEIKLLECEEEARKLNKVIVRVKNMLQQLTEDEKFVIETYYMKRAKWDYVEKAYFNEFEIHKSIKQLQSYRDNALNSMLEILNIGT